MTLKNYLREQIDAITNITDFIDREAATEDIKNNIYFRGPNVWILGFSILIASAGLNINSTPVIIGAMLISPLMGPIIGLGFGLGTNDSRLLKGSLKNLLVMVVISLIASYLYFLISPLDLANPTELESRTNPTIYDVIIALFGGFAGIFEQCRKKKGNVISGVAIATALMPPLCTAGYGLAHANFSFFFGALFLFFINSVFISLATYITVKYLNFKDAKYASEAIAKRTKKIVTIISILVIVPSVWSATIMIRHNNFERDVVNFISDNRDLGKWYIYDYKIETGKKNKVNLYIAGETMQEGQKLLLLNTAKNYGIDSSQVSFKEHIMSNDEISDPEKLMRGLYERTDTEINKRELEIKLLEEKIKEFNDKQIPYEQISKEIISQYPEIVNVYIARGAKYNADSTGIMSGILVAVDFKATEAEDSNDNSSKDSKKETSSKESENNTLKILKNWLKIRLHEDNITIISRQVE